MSDRPKLTAADHAIAEEVVGAWCEIGNKRKTLQLIAEGAARARGGVDLLNEAAAEMLADHMTSEHHHPDYVLVPTAAFNKIRAAIGNNRIDMAASMPIRLTPTETRS